MMKLTDKELALLLESDDNMEHFKAEMRRRVEELKQFERFTAERLNASNKKIWDDIKEAHGLTEDKQWSVNKITGEIRGEAIQAGHDDEGCGDPDCVPCKLRRLLSGLLGGAVEAGVRDDGVAKMENSAGRPFMVNLAGLSKTVH